MNTDFFIIIASVIFLMLFAYIYLKDTQNAKQQRLLAMSIDSLNKDVFKLRKEINEKFNALSSKQKNGDEEINNIESVLFDELEKLSDPIKKALETIEDNFKKTQDKTNARLKNAERSLKELVITQNYTEVDQDKIHKLSIDGFNQENIAKELHLSKAEVDFALKMKRLSQ
jgi:predicted transcriptional regulator